MTTRIRLRIISLLRNGIKEGMIAQVTAAALSSAQIGDVLALCVLA